ncbi:baseplate J/gp47 family protein [Fructilactobacillus florum]|uniref:baseplate J/gp47 family protein n=1 Tax=Fructilactobacillus florum TaxID=640331 RepID=UPI0006D21971|nr:baseplate J/gp47 family protein [Fructilactobacillus florum]
MGMTNNGYQLPSLSEIRKDVDNLFIKYFGEDIDLTDGQIEGLLSGILATVSSQNEQLGQAIYKAMFIQSSSGKNLEDHGTDIGIYRKLATESDVDLQIDSYVDPSNPTIVPAGTQFGTADGHLFATLAELKLTEPASYTDSGGKEHPLTDKYGNALARGTVQAKSMEAGYAENVMPNTIIVAENVVGGFYAVTNLDSATGGSDAETDEQLRNRILVNNRHVPSETKSGIETAIKNIAGVTDSRLIANNTMQDDSYGNPPKSCHLYVIGGDDIEIATTYFNHLTPVSTTVGKISVEVLDIAKKPVEIKFDRAKTVPIYIDVVLTVDDTQFNADSAPETIKKNILSYLSLLTMGSDVLFFTAFCTSILSFRR